MKDFELVSKIKTLDPDDDARLITYRYYLLFNSGIPFILHISIVLNI